jgi:amino acid transporter
MIYHAFASDTESFVPEWTFKVLYPNTPHLCILMDPKVTAAIAIILVTTLNLISQSMGTNSSVVITTVKLLALLFVAILGVISLARHGAGPALRPSTIFDGSSTSPGSYAIALYSGLWAFDGWDACSVNPTNLMMMRS